MTTWKTTEFWTVLSIPMKIPLAYGIIMDIEVTPKLNYILLWKELHNYYDVEVMTSSKL